MEEVVVPDLNVAVEDVLDDREGVGLGNSPLFFEERGEVTLGAELGDDVAVGGLTDHFVAPQDI